ncbi:MAG: glycosyl hydrolase [Nitrososphaeraceae archaeon]
MSTKLMVAMEDSVLLFESSKTGWKKVYEALKGTHPQCTAFDPNNPNRAYCGTFGGGLWKTDDGGQSWDSIGKERISSSDVMSVSVSGLERAGKNNKGFNTVYVGTEPSAFYRSDDGGESWDKMSSLNNLSSSSSWSFPPRPWTSHVRWIESDKTKPGYVYAAIEAGALVQSHDGGKTWIDKVKGGPYDTHTLATHKKMPGRLYSAAGDGYFESYDYGQTWKRSVTGLDDYDYLFGLAVDSGDPKTVVVSASSWPYKAYSLEDAESLVYRRTAYTQDSDDDNNNDEEWKIVSKGLPKPTGTLISVLAANPKIAGEFYAINNRGIFCSTDSGISWKMLEGLQWPNEYLSQHPWALAVRED